MKFTRILLALTFCTGLFLAPNLANAEGCTLEGVILNCASQGNSPEQITAAFASAETREELAYPLSRRINFKQNGDLEKYRKSMEKNWRTITRYARQQESRKKRRQLSEAEFQKWAKNFAEAEKTYRIALNFYRQLHWQGKK